MAKPSLTNQSRLIVGGDDWAADLTRSYLGLTVSDTLNTTGDPNEGREWNEISIGSYDRSLTVNTLYYGDEMKALKTREEGIILASAPGEWDGGAANWTALPTAAPVAEVLTSNVEFMSREPWASGTSVARFAFSSGNVSIDLPQFNNDDVVYLAVTKTVGGRVVTIGDGTDDVAVNFASPSIKLVDVTSLASSVDSGTLTVAALTGDQTIEGLFVAGRKTVLAGRIT